MTEIRALLYADRRALVNDVRRAIRSPGRFAIWFVYALGIAAVFVSRTLSMRHGANAGAGDLARADYLICAQVAGLGLVIAFGTGRVGFFRTLAEARFVIGSVVRAPVAIAYLQARASLSSALRWIPSLFYVGFILAPHRISALGAVTDVLIVAVLFAATSAIALPRKLARPPWTIAARTVGIPLALAATVPALRDLARQIPMPNPFTGPILHALPALHPGRMLTEPNPVWLLLPLAIGALATAVLASAGRDAYPELYTLSVLRLDNAAALADRRRRGKRENVPAVAAIPIRIAAPPGSLVLVWKSIVEFRRTRANLVVTGACAAVWIALGFAIARVVASFGATVLVGMLPFVAFGFFILSFIATDALALELRRSLFWLSGISLFERLGALVVAHNVRKVFTLVLIAIGVAAGGGSPLEMLIPAVAMPALVLLVGSIGFAVYAFVPNVAASGGPLAILRLFVLLALLAPVAAGGVLGALLDGNLAVAIVTVLALAECAALIAVAAWRVDGRIDRVTA